MTDYTEQDDKCYLVMEYIKGKSLNEYLKTNNLLSFEEILTITRTILQIFNIYILKNPNLLWRFKTREPDAHRNRQNLSCGFWQCFVQLRHSKKKILKEQKDMPHRNNIREY